MMKKKLIQILALVLAVSIPSTWAITTQTAKKSTIRAGAVGMVAAKRVSTADKESFKAESKSSGKSIHGLAKSFSGSLPASKVSSLTPLKVRDNLKFWGSVIYSDEDPVSGNAYHGGLCSINASGGFEELVYDMSANAGGFVADGIYYGVTYSIFWGEEIVYASKYDISDWSSSGNVTLDASFNSTCLTYDKTTGTVYGCFQDIDDIHSFWFGKASYDIPPSVTHISKIPSSNGLFNAMFTDDEGQVYAIDMLGDLYKINKENGEMSLVGATGFVPKYVCGAAFDSKSGKAYWTLASADEKTYLIEIDPTTGAGTIIHQFEHNDEITGLVVAVVAEDKAPAAPTNLILDFQGELTGNVSFTMPAALHDGTSASGSTQYTVCSDGKKISEGIALYGENVTVKVTVPYAGMQTIAVYCTNEVGEGPKVSTREFIGKDTPRSPENVNASWANGIFTITWNAVTESVNGGYLKSEEITYNIVRMPDDVVVAENISSTKVTDNVSEVAGTYNKYYYKVIAYNGEMASSPGISNTIGLGSMTPPYYNSLDDDGSFDDFMIIDANNDGRTWIYNSGNAQCSYHDSNVMNDYLVLPPMYLEAGKAYLFSMDAWARYTERVEVVYGNSPVPESMKTIVCEPKEIEDENPVTIEGYITPSASGIYYVAVHGISDPDQFFLFVDNITISAATSFAAPGAVSDIMLTPEAPSSKRSVVSFITPSRTLGGGNLYDLSKIEIYRDETLVKTFNNPATGTKLSFIDEVVESGLYKYTFKPFNKEGEGKSSSGTVFLGINIPAEPMNVKAVETNNIGEVTITWAAPDVDKDGNPIDASKIDYTIVDYNYGEYIDIAEGVKGLSYTFQALSDSEPQSLKQYAVFGRTESGTGYGTVSKMIAVGEPYSIPYEEPFAEASLGSLLGMETIEGYPSWRIYNPFSFTDVESDATGDNGFIAMNGESLDDSGMIYTGKISLAGAVSPTVSFYAFNIGNGDDINEISVLVKETGSSDFVEIGKFIMNSSVKTGWNKLSASLEDYKGKNIQIGLKATIKGYTFVLIDGIRVADTYDNDLAVKKLNAPVMVKPDSGFKIDAVIENIGRKQASGYKVCLYRDGELMSSLDGTMLKANEKKTFSFAQTLNVSNKNTYVYQVKVNYASDENNNDNESYPVEVQLKKSGLPAPTDLVANLDNDKYVLSWKAPNLDEAVINASEDFEECESFATSLDEWTFFDGDGYRIGTIQDYSLPIAIQGPQSFWVHDSDWESFKGNPTFAANSGKKCLASMFRADDGTVDDWVISPILIEKSQTISFYARSYDDRFAETIEVLYSNEGIDVSDFKLIETFEELPMDWMEYSFNVPEGAKYFAIRSVATGSFMLLIDDISFKSSASGLTLKGYNIYRDGIKVNTDLVQTQEFIDEMQSDFDHQYDVSAVYTEGESGTIGIYTGQGGTAAIEANKIIITGENGRIFIRNAAGLAVNISATDGKMLFQRMGEDDMSIPMARGIYIVKVGNTVVKAFVK